MDFSAPHKHISLVTARLTKLQQKANVAMLFKCVCEVHVVCTQCLWWGRSCRSSLVKCEQKKMSFKKTEKLSRAIASINELEQKTLYHVLRIVLSSSTPPTRKETEFLKSVNNEDAISGIKYVFESALYLSMNPDKLYNGLLEVDLNEEHAQIFKAVWEQEGRSVVAKARDREMCPQTLQSFSWRLQLHMSEQNLSKLKAPNCLFQFNLKNDSFYSDENKEEELVVEFSQDELYSFFNNLETIQSQLDELQ